jgi:hypothetical protein
MTEIKDHSKSLQKRIEKTKAAARSRVIKRGIMHFRCDEEMMEQLLQVAQYKKLPVGSMVRSWVAEKLRKEHPAISN